MAKGRYIKAAERACAHKARFETAAAAEAFGEYRYRAYACPVCHHYHLTSQGRPANHEPGPPGPTAPAPKLADLDWSAALDPQPKAPKPRPAPTPPKPPTEPDVPLPEAVCAAPCGKDGRVRLVIGGKLVKSAKVDPALRAKLARGARVQYDDRRQPPVVLGLVP